MTAEQRTPLDLSRFEGHTPGPWKLRTHAELPPFVEADCGKAYGLDVCGDDYEGFGGRVQREKNMKLIAAAPALLAECRIQRAALEAAAQENARMREALENVLPLAERVTFGSHDNYNPSEWIAKSRAALGRQA